MITKLWLRIPKGVDFDPASLVGVTAAHWDFIDHGDDRIGVLHSGDGGAHRDLCTSLGVHVLPPLHRPAKDHHIAAFAEFGAAAGDFGHDIAEKLHDHFKMPWMHPERPRDT